ncbi:MULTISPECIES: MinD/ParA family ATP-binding protein [Bacillus cereus group]|uniref:MinD/ParA family ATP-binding protein n=1 Tax=Bacillus cereus group TaxID=86661 RepID=UPI0005CDE8AE|nr:MULTISPECIES: AAA family ATPase [Bacillus cereus group]TBL20070.1 hypothetical protein EYB35_01725 [Bacillus paranthracis]
MNNESINNNEIKSMAFWSNHVNEGKRTISQAVAQTLAKNDKRVLYVELDYLHPSFALSTGLTHPNKNMMRLIESRENFSIMNYIANKNDVIVSEAIREAMNKIPENLYFLSFPADYLFNEFPKLENPDFINTFITAIKECNFDITIFNLPNNLDDLFAYPVMLEVDRVFHIISPNLLRMQEYKKTRQVLENVEFDMHKWSTILNKSIMGISPHVYEEQALKEEIVFEISWDMKRPQAELELEIGSNGINEEVETLLSNMGFELKKSSIVPERKSKFNLFSRG